jgi:hypothetical protein
VFSVPRSERVPDTISEPVMKVPADELITRAPLGANILLSGASNIRFEPVIEPETYIEPVVKIFPGASDCQYCGPEFGGAVTQLSEPVAYIR